MVLLYVLSEDKTQIEAISKNLLEKHFVTTVNIDWDRDRMFLENGVLSKKKANLLTCITKALLFQKIDTFIREKYPDNIPEIFTSPIINMDWDLAQSLLDNTEKI